MTVVLERVHVDVVFSRHVAAANRWTFTIRPIRELLERYVLPGQSWVDPYAGKHSPATMANDLNPELPTYYHMDALAFAELAAGMGPWDGVLFDPPYSYRQVSEHYKAVGIKATALDTSNNYYNRVMNAICDAIKPGGYAISCGWNSNGFGRNRGFELVEVMLIAHGAHHNDTIVVVERRLAV